MSNSKKVRADAVLLNLPRERQDQIMEWCNTAKSESCVGGLQFAREQLAADGVKVSLNALSHFWRQYQLRESYEQAENFAEFQEEQMKRFRPEDLETARKFGKFTFLQVAQAKQDGKLFATVEQLIQGDEIGALNARKQKFKEEIEPRKLRLLERRVDLMETKLQAIRDKLAPVPKGEVTTAEQREEILRMVDEAMGLKKAAPKK